MGIGSCSRIHSRSGSLALLFCFWQQRRRVCYCSNTVVCCCRVHWPGPQFEVKLPGKSSCGPVYWGCFFSLWGVVHFLHTEQYRNTLCLLLAVKLLWLSSFPTETDTVQNCHISRPAVTDTTPWRAETPLGSTAPFTSLWLFLSTFHQISTNGNSDIICAKCLDVESDESTFVLFLNTKGNYFLLLLTYYTGAPFRIYLIPCKTTIAVTRTSH